MENKEIGPPEYRQHVVRARSHSGSDANYCREHGLNYARFSYHKKQMEKLKFAKVTLAPKVGVQLAKANHVLPDPKWLAEFLRAFES